MDVERQLEVKQWKEFCSKKIDKIERLWNRKLENSDHGSDDERGNSEFDRDTSQEDTISQLLSNFDNQRFKRGQSVNIKKTAENQAESDDLNA
jgi:hypothetical protein